MKTKLYLLPLLGWLLTNTALAGWHELLHDNSFEQQSGYWSAYYLSGGDPLSAGIVNYGNAHTGTWYGYLGDVNTFHSNALGVVRQDVTIPAYATTVNLNYWLSVTSQETTTTQPYDKMGAYLRTYPGDVQVINFHEWSNLDKDPNGVPNNYVQQIFSASVSPYAGQPMILQFYAQTDGSFSTTFRIDDVSLQAYVPDYTISVAAGPNGSVSPSGNNTVESGQTLGMAASPNQNYTVDQWYVDNVSKATGGNSFYIGVDGNHFITVTFKRIVYTVSVSAGGNGTVNPSGDITVNAGDSLPLTATPAQGYSVDKWTVNGSVIQTGGTSFALNNVQAPTVVSVSFIPILYNLKVTILGQGGYAVSPPGNAFPAGTQITVSATPAIWNQFSEWRGSQYSRNPILSFSKGGADEALEVHFVPDLATLDLNLTTANSTPTTIGVNLPTPPSWMTIFERSDDLGLWAIISAVTGQNPTTLLSVPNTGSRGYIRTLYCPVVTTAPFLDFPIHGSGADPVNAGVISIFDHSRPNDLVSVGLYNKDHYVRTAQGATYFVPPEDRGPDPVTNKPRDYAPLPPGTIVSTLFTYVGYSSQGSTANLQYDGHPGYDYKFGCDTDVYAAAPGVVMTDTDFVGTTLDGTGIASYYMSKLHALIIKHDPPGYCTIYMHLNDVDAPYVDKSDPNAWKPVKALVNLPPYHVGKSGDFDAISPVGCHLHFEVWRLDAGTDWNYADPYGFFITNPDGSTVTAYPRLWK